MTGSECLSVGNGLRAVRVRPRATLRNGTEAVPYRTTRKNNTNSHEKQIRWCENPFSHQRQSFACGV